jgi:hypothetical protein
VLSQNFIYQHQNIIHTNFSFLYQRNYSLKVSHHYFIGQNGTITSRRPAFVCPFQCFRYGVFLSTAGVEKSLFYLPFLVLIIFNASLGGTSLSVGFSAAKWTAKVFAPGISGMGEKKYATMPAPGQTLS